jgi:hypothetical protein
MKAKIRKGDTVEIISGRSEDKGKRGEVIRVLPDESRVVVQSMNSLRAGQSIRDWCALKHRCTFPMLCWSAQSAVKPPVWRSTERAKRQCAPARSAMPPSMSRPPGVER